MRLAWLLVCCAPAWGADCLIGGSVRDAESNKPLARVHVYAKPPATPPNAPAVPARTAIARLTDAAGGFCFDSLEAGSYQLVAQHAGYLVAIYGARPGRTEGTPFNVNGRTPLPPVTVRMTAGAIISGTVLDERGQPVEGVMVDVQRKIWDWVWEPVHVTFTRSGAGGVFRVPMVAPGTYYLRTEPMDLPLLGPIVLPTDLELPRTVLDEQGRPLAQTSAPTYYSASYTFARATPIAVRAGQELGNVVLALNPLAARRLSGRVSGPFAPQALADAEVVATPAIDAGGPAGRPHAVGIRPDGAFSLTDLGPQEYDVKVGGLPASLSAKVDLSAGDVDGLTLQPTRIYDLRVTGRIEGQEGAPTQAVAICDLETGCNQRNPPDAQGVYHYGAVRAGVYRLQSKNSGVYVKSLLADGRLVSDGQIDLRRSAPESLAVVLGTRLAALDGQLERADAAASALAVSILLVNELRYGPPVSYTALAADSAGRVHFDSVTPGRYRVLAIEGYDDGPWGSPDLMAVLREKSVAVELGEGDRKSVTLTAIPVAEWEAALRKVGM